MISGSAHDLAILSASRGKRAALADVPDILRMLAVKEPERSKIGRPGWSTADMREARWDTP
ncbi:hypothetical protein Hesp01_38060 [Herbidospora sp. NBRC 101105]|nr:hypothetical protein Hesp01_38060 [Herbidospora sp. NBRC 101105]